MKERDYAPETKSLVNALLAAGFTIRNVDDGGDNYPFDGSVDALVGHITGVNESTLRVTTPGGVRCSLLLVLGNSPGELVCDYSDIPALEAVCSAEADLWADREQPEKDA